jgi:hypothetical protein
VISSSGTTITPTESERVDRRHRDHTVEAGMCGGDGVIADSTDGEGDGRAGPRSNAIGGLDSGR